MMGARADIEAEYTIRNGLIRSPGKFEAEPIFAPYFSEHASEGDELSTIEETGGTYVSLVPVEPDDRSEFPELGVARYVLVTENDRGFVSVETIDTEEQAEEIRADHEPEDGEDEESTEIAYTLFDDSGAIVEKGTGTPQDVASIASKFIHAQAGEGISGRIEWSDTD